MLNGTLPSLNMGMSLGQQLGVRHWGTCRMLTRMSTQDGVSAGSYALWPWS